MNVSFTLSQMFRLFNQEACDQKRSLLLIDLTTRVNKLVLITGVMLLSFSLNSQELIELDEYLTKMQKDNQTQKVVDDESSQLTTAKVESEIYDSKNSFHMLSHEINASTNMYYSRMIIEADQLADLSAGMERMKDQFGGVKTFVIKIRSREDIENLENLTSDLLDNLPDLNRIFFMVGFKASAKDLDVLYSFLPQQEDPSKAKTPISEDGSDDQENIVYLYKITMPG